MDTGWQQAPCPRSEPLSKQAVKPAQTLPAPVRRRRAGLRVARSRTTAWFL